MLFNHRRPQRHTRDRHADAHRVVRQTDVAAEEFPEMWNRAQVRVTGSGGVGAGALEQYEIATPRISSDCDGVIEFGQGGHTRRDDERLARGRDTSD